MGKTVEQHYPVAARVDKLRIIKADECTRTYKNADWPVELQDEGSGIKEKHKAHRQNKQRRTHRGEEGPPSVTLLELHTNPMVKHALLDLAGEIRNSSNDILASGSRSSAWKLCCCKTLYAVEKYEQGHNEGALGSAEACQRQWKCQQTNSKFPQSTNDIVCKFGELMGNLQDAIH